MQGLSLQMCSEIRQALEEAGEDDGVALAILVGAGEQYCSGIDLSNFMQIGPDKFIHQAR